MIVIGGNHLVIAGYRETRVRLADISSPNRCGALTPPISEGDVQGAIKLE